VNKVKGFWGFVKILSEDIGMNEQLE